jgi:hypothetical protein
MLALGCAGLLQAAAFGDPPAPAAPAPDRAVSRFRVGPLFEQRATRDGGSFWALRPFYSDVSDPACGLRVRDAVWPLATVHDTDEQRWWRVLLAYGSDLDVSRDDSAWNLAVFPFYFEGRTRQGEAYSALFPIYGHWPHMLLMDDVSFELFPVHLDYKVNGVEREYYLWPIFSHMGEETGVKRTGFFPLYGRTERRDDRHTYRLWPFWTSSVYGGERNPGTSWMLFPLCGRVERKNERQWLVLPPFFSHAKTDSAERWRKPWPFSETVVTPTSKKRSFWPWYGDFESESERRWFAAWPLIESFTLTSKGRRTERSRFFPFYVGQTVYESDASGAEHVKETYTRVWPFFSRVSGPEGSHLRALELSLIRFSGGIERNWAPFWTVYERIEKQDETVHDALWGLFQSRRAAATESAGEDSP